MNHNSRYDVSKRKRRDVPEELLHGVASFREACPTPGTLHSPAPHGKVAPPGTPELSGVGVRFTASPATIATLP